MDAPRVQNPSSASSQPHLTTYVRHTAAAPGGGRVVLHATAGSKQARMMGRCLYAAPIPHSEPVRPQYPVELASMRGVPKPRDLGWHPTHHLARTTAPVAVRHTTSRV